jgi:MoaA/NifB/PqqE/SkfB family radical SAM enzyme
MIQKVELEITSDCNAACPGCARTLHSNHLKVNSFTFEDLKRIFPNDNYNGVEFKFCGVLGDPVVNPDCYKMTEYLLERNAYCEYSTNGGYNSQQWWIDLGKLAQKYIGKLHVHFCVDGHKDTNHIYRVNTKWSTIERNMIAFSENAPQQHATWVFIEFDHNEKDLVTARAHAAVLGFDFATRTGMRNSYHQWISHIGKKNNKETKVITTTGSKEHKQKDVAKELDKFILEYKTKKRDTDQEKVKNIIDTITCKYVHEQEIFIANDLTVWPCCFLWDSVFKNSEKIVDKLNYFDDGWNSLKKHSLDDILNHEWYKKLLESSWTPGHPLHLTRCIKTCAKNKAYHNELYYVETNETRK